MSFCMNIFVNNSICINVTVAGPGSVDNLKVVYTLTTSMHVSWTAPTYRGCPAVPVENSLQYVVSYQGETLLDGCSLSAHEITLPAAPELFSNLESLIPYYRYSISVYAEGGETNVRTTTGDTQAQSG